MSGRSEQVRALRALATPADPDGPLDWLIVGGGLHGTHAAIRLVGDAGVDPRQLRIVDPAPALFQRWRARTRAMEMSYLRSPAVHNLGLTPDALQRFAGRRRDRALGLFAQPYERPALHLFDAHCDDLVERFGLAACHLRSSVQHIRPRESSVDVQLADGRTLEAARVLLATGPGRPAARADWAAEVEDSIEQWLDPAHRWTAPPPGTRAVVIGGGMTAAHVALRLVNEGAQVDVVARHELRAVQFDTDPGWLGPKFMARFERTGDLRQRRGYIDRARHRGSITADLELALRPALRSGRLRWRTGRVERARSANDGADLRLSDGSSVHAHRVHLCTGFAPGPPSRSLVGALAAEAGLPLSPCGFPVVDRSLRWQARIQVSGALAELTLGPTARNIAGARRACDRIVATAREATVLRSAEVAG